MDSKMTNTDKLYISLGLIKQAQSLPSVAPANYPQSQILGPAISIVDYEKEHGPYPGSAPINTAPISSAAVPKAMPVKPTALTSRPPTAVPAAQAAPASSVPSYLSPMLSAIRSAESRTAGYNTMVGSSRNHNLTNKSIGDLIKYQTKYKQNNPKLTAAAGAYQLIPGTLSETVKRMKLNPKKDIYDQNLQDRIAHNLMQNRGVDAYLQGKMPLEKIRTNLAKEWAGLPIAGGKSYYARDGKNKANISEESYLNALKQMKELYSSSVQR